MYDLASFPTANAVMWPRAALRADPKLGAAMRRIEALVQAVGPPAPPGIPTQCVYRPGDETHPKPPQLRTLTGPGRPGGLPQGVYRFNLTADDLRADGQNETFVVNNIGVYTWTIRDGTWSYTSEGNHLRAFWVGRCDGWYAVEALATNRMTRPARAPSNRPHPPAGPIRRMLGGPSSRDNT